MHDDKQWQQWRQQWQNQTVEKPPDIQQIKKRVFKHRLQKLVLIGLDIALLIIIIYFLASGLGKSWSAMVWLTFGLVFGTIVAVLSTIERLKTWRINATTTREWLDYEIQRANSRITLARLTRISAIVFALFFHLWFLMTYLYDSALNLGFNKHSLIAYVFTLLWLSGAWLFSRRMQRSAINQRQKFLEEKQWLNKT